jgi:hypothetical protein
MEITGNIKVIQDVESGTSKAGNEWQKRNIVVTTAGDYPQHLLIEFFGKTVQALESFQVGNPVKVHINLKGNEYNGKYYNSISGWKIENYIAEHTNEAQNPAREVETIDSGDLPF